MSERMANRILAIELGTIGALILSTAVYRRRFARPGPGRPREGQAHVFLSPPSMPPGVWRSHP
jgi:hypothetical protein